MSSSSPIISLNGNPSTPHPHNLSTRKSFASPKKSNNDLSEGFMYYSGFVGSEPPTPKASARVGAGSPSATVSTIGGSPDMVNATSGMRSPKRQGSGSGEYELGMGEGNGGKFNQYGIRDELDEVTYGYALRVAYINRLLQTAINRPSPSATPSISSPNLQTPSTANSYFSAQSSPSLSGSSPGASPNIAGVPFASVSSNASMGKSGFFGKKKDKEGAKLPKDFMPGFWDILGNEGGDAVWRTSVNTFLSYLPNKKATKTASGLNLREIPILLETFTSVLPSAPGATNFGTANNAGITPHKHAHVTHLIATLQTALQGYYNPMNKKLKDEDKEMYLRIRNELDAWSLRPEPGRTNSEGGQILSPALELSGGKGMDARKSSFMNNMGGASNRKNPMPPPALPNTPSYAGSSASSANGSPITRTMSISSVSVPSGRTTPESRHTGASIGGRAGDMIDVVRRVFGVEGPRLMKDLEGLRRAGLDEKSYLSDLKQHLVRLNADARSKDSTQIHNRIHSLQTEIGALMHARPDLSGMNFGRASVSSGNGLEKSAASSDFFFTPSDRLDEIYGRLIRQARLTLSYDTPLASDTTGERELVELCAGIWGINGKSIKELAATLELWATCVENDEDDDELIGSQRMIRTPVRRKASYNEEFGWAERVKEDMFELEMDAESGLEAEEKEQAAAVLGYLHGKIIDSVTGAIRSIYPTTAIPPVAPPPSVFTVCSALYAHDRLQALVPAKEKAQAWKDAADDLRAAAVGEYVQRQSDFLGGDGDILVGAGAETDKSLEGYEKLADFIDGGIKRVGKVWPKDRLDGRLYPPAVILSKQLPLFLAELQVLDVPSTGTKADVIFGLYERTARLMHLWEDCCPGDRLDFDLDGFFEPHVREWLRGTNEVDTHEWVSRAVGMDSWVPEGNLRHSQSVLDLFQFIRNAVSTILVDLPLTEYNRACYLIDFSKTAAASVCQYASTVEALFVAEMSPLKAGTPTTEAPPAVTGKAGAWLAKSKQAIQSLDRKKVEGFSIPPTACVKLTDMGAAKHCLDDLTVAMEADETARVVKEHKLKIGGGNGAQDKPTRYLFTVTVSRGENLLGKGLSKAADSFVTVSDHAASGRVFKSNTIMNRVDPSWEESFEMGISGAKVLDIAAFDRSLVGKHDLIGTGSLKLDPAAFKEIPSKELLVPLNPRGTLHIRVDMEGGEKHEVKFHLDRAGRALDRAGEAMTRCIVDRMNEFIKTQLSLAAVRELLKPLTAKPKKGVVKQTTISDQEYEQSLAPLFDYFDSTFSTFAVTFSDEVKIHTMTQIWKRVLDVLMSSLIPPLSDKESSADPLTPQEINVVFQWLRLLKAFFNAAEGSTEHGVPLTTLQSATYKDILLIGQYLDLPVPALKEKCVAAIRGIGRSSSKGAHGGAHVGVGKGEEEEERTAEILLRILRMRPGTSDFLSQQIVQLNEARVRKQNAAA